MNLIKRIAHSFLHHDEIKQAETLVSVINRIAKEQNDIRAQWIADLKFKSGDATQIDNQHYHALKALNTLVGELGLSFRCLAADKLPLINLETIHRETHAEAGIEKQVKQVRQISDTQRSVGA
jgi:hypothetical protein